MASRRILITGANAGIGYETALGLARTGAEVIMLCRDQSRGEAARNRIRWESGSLSVELMLCDLASQSSIRKFAAEFQSRFESLDVLINNAAVLSQTRQLTDDGIELQWAVNHLAPFLLTHLLQSRLMAAESARVLNVSSGMHRRGKIDFDNLQGERNYHPRTIYAQTKLANVLFTVELAKRLEETGITCNALHPGTIATGLYQQFLGLPKMLSFVSRWYGKSPRTGAETSIYLATSEEVAGQTGLYFRNRRPAPMNPVANDCELRSRLWELSAEMTELAAV
ncbi:SDR family oxidoreductase [Thalassoroseus pseudoceratinae]|uniref:SDR family oxidoreductase n=1 Tax=Thalassoroseus pseudoceratinae TaxID=2713176 RepID=UPI001423E195|nr:SDR family oxidoreductase [Thalassoroseus pseudoceratinae]